MLKVVLHKGRLLWNLRIINTDNGRIVLTSETYFSKSNAIRAARRVATESNIRFDDVYGRLPYGKGSY